MVIKWGRETFYDEYDIRRAFGISPETLAMWGATEPLLTMRMHSKTVYEEQSLRACIARHKGDKSK